MILLGFHEPVFLFWGDGWFDYYFWLFFTVHAFPPTKKKKKKSEVKSCKTSNLLCFALLVF